MSSKSQFKKVNKKTKSSQSKYDYRHSYMDSLWVDIVPRGDNGSILEDIEFIKENYESPPCFRCAICKTMIAKVDIGIHCRVGDEEAKNNIYLILICNRHEDKLHNGQFNLHILDMGVKLYSVSSATEKHMIEIGYERG